MSQGIRKVTEWYIQGVYFIKSLLKEVCFDAATVLKGEDQFVVKTQRNSTQLNATLKQLALELDIVVTCTPPHPPHPTTNFSTTSRPARELKFCTDTH